MTIVKSLGFQSTSLIRGTTPLFQTCPLYDFISIHVPHKRDDVVYSSAYFCAMIFQSTSLIRGTTAMMHEHRRLWLFQSTSLIRGTTKISSYRCGTAYISIHVPHKRDDPDSLGRTVLRGISIHVPHKRDDSASRRIMLYTSYFNPRPS